MSATTKQLILTRENLVEGSQVQRVQDGYVYSVIVVATDVMSGNETVIYTNAEDRKRWSEPIELFLTPGRYLLMPDVQRGGFRMSVLATKPTGIDASTFPSGEVWIRSIGRADPHARRLVIEITNAGVSAGGWTYPWADVRANTEISTDGGKTWQSPAVAVDQTR